jgi:hypothetical protein
MNLQELRSTGSQRISYRNILTAGVIGLVAVLSPAQAADLAESTAVSASKLKTFIDYFLPTPSHGDLSRDAWGATNVLPRDVRNGLENITNKYCYWDGQIIKASDGKYHVFASRWDESRGHNGWFGSVAVHAVSDSLFGPYVDKGLCWPDEAGGRGHNVTALTLPDGRYAIVISETRPCEVYVSESLDGPWEHLGTITVEGESRSFRATGGSFSATRAFSGPTKRRARRFFHEGFRTSKTRAFGILGGFITLQSTLGPPVKPITSLLATGFTAGRTAGWPTTRAKRLSVTPMAL